MINNNKIIILCKKEILGLPQRIPTKQNKAKQNTIKTTEILYFTATLHFALLYSILFNYA
jgi:hypothetical protein